MNLQQLYNASARLCNIIADNEALTSSDLSICQENLSTLLDVWSVNPRLQWGREIIQFPTTSGVTDVTFTSRPIHIQQIQWNYNTSNTVFYNVELIDERTYYSINFRQITAPVSKAYWDHNVTLRLYPAPADGLLTVVAQMPIIQDVTDLTTELTFPPGYYAALKYSLAAMLFDEFGKTDTNGVAQKAADLVSVIQAQNQRPELVKQNVGQMFTKGGSWSYVPLINR